MGSKETALSISVSVIAASFPSRATLGQDRYFAIRRFGESVNHVALCIEVAQGKQFIGSFQMAEAVDFIEEGSALYDLVALVVKVCAATAGEEERSGMAVEFEVLQVMIVPGKVEVHLVFAEKRLPVCDEHLVIAMRAV